MTEQEQDKAADSMFDLLPMEKVDHPRRVWADIADFLRAPKAAKYPRPEDFAQTRFGPP